MVDLPNIGGKFNPSPYRPYGSFLSIATIRNRQDRTVYLESLGARMRTIHVNKFNDRTIGLAALLQDLVISRVCEYKHEEGVRKMLDLLISSEALEELSAATECLETQRCFGTLIRLEVMIARQRESRG